MPAPSLKDFFVGRQREMEELTAALDDARAGRGRVVMLVGEPGIGKTRTAEELAAIARERGVEALWGRCPEDPGAPPFWPWAQVVRAHAGRLDRKRLQREMGDTAAYVAEVVPELAAQEGFAAPGPLPTDPERARFALFDAFATLLRRAAAARPLVIVFDNLHWADGSSLRLLEFIAAEVSDSPLLILGTYRDVDVARGHPLYHTLGELTRQRLFQRIALRGLGGPEVGRMVEEVAGTAPPDDLVAQVHAHTEGNPFFVREVTALLRQERLLSVDRMRDLKSWDFRLPEGVKEVIGRRLDRLTPQCNAVLRVASVIGREFNAELLGRLLVNVPPPEASTSGAPGSPGEVPRPSLGFQRPQDADRPAQVPPPDHRTKASAALKTSAALRVLEEALEAHIIEDVPGTPAHFRFAHALFERTLREEIPTTQRVHLHALIGEALENYYREGIEQHAAELAHHFAASETLTGHEKVTRYSLLAGEQALAVHAYEDAERHFERALQSLERAPGTPATAATLSRLAASLRLGLTIDSQQSAWRAMARAFDTYVEVGQPEAAVKVALTRFRLGTVTADVPELYERALRLVPADSLDAGWLQTRRAVGLFDSGHDAEAGDALGIALAVARAHGDALLEFRVTLHQCQRFTRHDELEVAADWGLKAVAVSRATGDPEQIYAFWWTLVCLGSLGRIAESEALSQEFLRLAVGCADERRIREAVIAGVGIARMRGEWMRADELLREFDGKGRKWYIADLRGALMLEQGAEVDAGWAFVPPRWPELVQPPAYLMPVDRLREIPDAALRLASEAQASEANARTVRGRRLATIRRGIVAVVRRDSDAAADVYRRLSGVSTPLGEWSNWHIDRIRGLLCVTSGQIDAAFNHFERAAAFCREHGCRPELARTLADYGEALADHAGAGRAARAREVWAEGLQLSRELSMSHLERRFSSLEGRLATLPRGGRPEYPDGLTEREVEVLRLVAAGKSNADIAQALVITLNTAAKHVANILLKTGASNRTEAAAYAHKHGLAGEVRRQA
jgi:DNA-binding CsgD family transcriptional regulator